MVGRNVRVGRNEVDLVIRQGSVLAVVEVRTRGRASFETAFGSVRGGKLAGLRRASELLWAWHGGDRTLTRTRVDVVAVRFDGGVVEVEEFRGAA